MTATRSSMACVFSVAGVLVSSRILPTQETSCAHSRSCLVLMLVGSLSCRRPVPRIRFRAWHFGCPGFGERDGEKGYWCDTTYLVDLEAIPCRPLYSDP